MGTSLSPEASQEHSGFSFGACRLEPDGTLQRANISVHLPPKELAALRILLENAGQIVSPSKLRAALWGDIHVSADGIPRCISSLRARLAVDDCIQTIYKRGYRISAAVRRAERAIPANLPRLAIVPFACAGNVAEHLGPAIAEETTARLTAANPALVSLLARDSVFTLARRGMSAQQIGQVLNADLVLTGTLHALPSQFRLRVEMVRVRDGIQIWVEDMLVTVDGNTRLESELVERLTSRIGSGFSISAAAEESHYDSEAYDSFLRGRHEWRTLERHRMLDGTEHLVRATELDPTLVSARVDLVNACITQSLYGFVAPSVAASQVRRVAASVPDFEQNAVALLPALGWVSFHIDRNLPSALHMFSLSAGVPHDPWITRTRAFFALSRHRFDAACALLEETIVLDPYAPWTYARLAWAHYLAGRTNESVAKIETCLSLFPDHNDSNFYGAIIFAFCGDCHRAAAMAEKLCHWNPYVDLVTAVYAYALARAGRSDDALALLERLEWLGRERYVSASFTAAAYAALGDSETAIAQLRAANEARCPWFFQVLADLRLSSLHGHPEFLRMSSQLQDMEEDLEAHAARQIDLPGLSITMALPAE